MKKLIFIFIVFSMAIFVNAGERKGQITGKLIGKNNHSPIEYAAVALYDSRTHQTITGVITDSIGFFHIDNVASGNYSLVCSYVGYKDVHTKTFNINNSHQIVNIGTLLMNDSGELLNDIVITGKRSTYTQTIDKKIFNVGSDIASNSGSVSDLIQNIPSVQVDIEGNIALRGNENVLVLIDGKPSVMMKGANRGTVLQQLPANTIEQIEVITNPSAQFKPDGTSGIINLITKKEKKAGLNGSVVANVGNDSRYNGGILLTYTTPQFSISGNYGYRRDRRDRFTTNQRTLTEAISGKQTDVTQQTVSKAPATSHIGGLGLKWNPTSKDRFEMNGNYTYMTFPRTEDNQMTQWSNAQIQKEYNRHRFDNERQKEGEGGIGYIHSFTKDRTLALDYTYAMQDEVEKNYYTNIFIQPSAYETKDNTTIKQKHYENLIRTVYESKMQENNKVVIGYEAELDKSDMRYLASDYQNDIWIKNIEKSNDFIFNEQVHSIYTTYEQTLGKFGFLAGLRGEQSFIKSNLLTLNQQVKDNYFMFYPTLHTSYHLNDHNEIQLNYSLRVNRPEGDDLNPFPEYQDPYNIKAGNPFLKPEKIHSVEFGWQWKHEATTMVLTPYYRYTFNKMTEITQVMNDGIMKTTKENMSSSSASGVEFILNSTVRHWLTYNLNSNIFYNKIDASDLGYSNKKGAMAWYVALNANMTIQKNLIFQLNTRYNSPFLTPQGNKNATFITNIGAKYDIPHYNLSLTATISDLFDTYKNVTKIHTETINQRIEKRRSPRTFYLGASYRFGNNKKTKKQNTELQYDESF